MSYSYEESNAFDIKFAKHYIDDKECGELHLQWMIDRYWGQYVHSTILPQVIFLYDYLINKDHHINNKYDYGDFDASIYFIPTDNNKKVIVLKSNSYNFVLIVSDNQSCPRFDIRKIYRADNSWVIDEAKKSIDNVLLYAEDLLEIKCASARRNGLDFYESINWEIPSYTNNVFGDGRDMGYVLSYQIENEISNQKIEHTIGVYSALKYATDYISWICDDIQNKTEETVLKNET